MVTLTKRVIDYVAEHPGLTAWQIARKLNESSGTVSSLLHRACGNGLLVREAKVDITRSLLRPEPWRYYPPTRKSRGIPERITL